MNCPKCNEDMDYTGWWNLGGGGDYICKSCKQKISVYFEDLTLQEKLKYNCADDDYVYCTECKNFDYEEDDETPCCKVDSSEFNDPGDSKPLSERCCYEE